MAAALPAGCEFPPSNVYPYNAPGDPRQFAVGEQVCVQDGSAAPYVGTFNSWTQQGPTNRTTIRVNGPAAGQVRTVSWMHVGKMNGPPTVWPPTLFTHGAPPVYQGGVWGPEGPYPQFPYPPGTGNPTAPGQYVPPPAGVPLAMAPAGAYHVAAPAPALPPIFVGDAYGNPLAAHHLLGAHNDPDTPFMPAWVRDRLIKNVGEGKLRARAKCEHPRRIQHTSRPKLAILRSDGRNSVYAQRQNTHTKTCKGTPAHACEATERPTRAARTARQQRTQADLRQYPATDGETERAVPTHGNRDTETGRQTDVHARAKSDSVSA